MYRIPRNPLKVGFVCIPFFMLFLIIWSNLFLALSLKSNSKVAYSRLIGKISLECRLLWPGLTVPFWSGDGSETQTGLVASWLCHVAQWSASVPANSICSSPGNTYQVCHNAGSVHFGFRFPWLWTHWLWVPHGPLSSCAPALHGGFYNCGTYMEVTLHLGQIRLTSTNGIKLAFPTLWFLFWDRGTV